MLIAMKSMWITCRQRLTLSGDRKINMNANLHLHVIAPGQHSSSYRRNVTAVASPWKLPASDLTDPRFEPQTCRSKDECVTARQTAGRSFFEQDEQKFNLGTQDIFSLRIFFTYDVQHLNILFVF